MTNDMPGEKAINPDTEIFYSKDFLRYRQTKYIRADLAQSPAPASGEREKALDYFDRSFGGSKKSVTGETFEYQFFEYERDTIRAALTRTAPPMMDSQSDEEWRELNGKIVDENKRLQERLSYLEAITAPPMMGEDKIVEAIAEAQSKWDGSKKDYEEARAMYRALQSAGVIGRGE